MEMCWRQSRSPSAGVGGRSSVARAGVPSRDPPAPTASEEISMSSAVHTHEHTHEGVRHTHAHIGHDHEHVDHSHEHTHPDGTTHAHGHSHDAAAVEEHGHAH